MLIKRIVGSMMYHAFLRAINTHVFTARECQV